MVVNLDHLRSEEFEGQSLLSVAITEDHEAIVDFLLKNGADLRSHKISPVFGATPGMLTILVAHARKSGDLYHILTQLDDLGQNIFHHAAEAHSADDGDCLRLFLTLYHEVHARRAHALRESGMPKVLAQVTLSYLPSPVEKKSRIGETPFQMVLRHWGIQFPAYDYGHWGITKTNYNDDLDVLKEEGERWLESIELLVKDGGGIICQTGIHENCRQSLPEAIASRVKSLHQELVPTYPVLSEHARECINIHIRVLTKARAYFEGVIISGGISG